jgi:hypothetical protein
MSTFFIRTGPSQGLKVHGIEQLILPSVVQQDLKRDLQPNAPYKTVVQQQTLRIQLLKILKESTPLIQKFVYKLIELRPKKLSEVAILAAIDDLRLSNTTVLGLVTLINA